MNNIPIIGGFKYNKGDKNQMKEKKAEGMGTMNRKEKQVDVEEYFANREPIGEVLSGEELFKAAVKYMEELTSKISPEEEAAFIKELSEMRRVKRDK